MKLLVFMFGSLERIRRASTVTAIGLGVAIMVFGAPPITLFIAIVGGAVLIGKTQDWMQRHPEGP